MLSRLAPSAVALTFLLSFAAAVGVALYVIRPLDSAAVDFDSAASVLFFERLVSGRHLEAWVGATPKPLMTLVFGGLHALVPDWRLIVWATIAAYATSVALATVLVRRLAGPAAAAFTAVALVGASPLLVDVARGYSAAWAMLGWVVAALAVSGERPRYGLAALALALASLARVETFVLIGAATGGLVIWTLRSRSGRVAPPPRAAWWLPAAFVALPVMLAHDWLLTGDAFFWLKVSARFSEAAADAVARQGALTIAGSIGQRFIELGGFALLSMLGVGLLIARRRWRLALGVAAATVGVAAFLVFLAARGTYVSSRYLVPIDLAVLFAAGLGFGELRVPSISRSSTVGDDDVVPVGASTRWRTAGLIVIGIVSAAALWAPLAGDIRSDIGQIRNLTDQARRADRVVPVIRQAVANVPGGGGESDTSAVLAPAELDRLILVVPSALRPRLAVDADVALTRIAGLGAPDLGTPGSLVHVPGRIIVHDPGTEGSAAPSYAALEAPDPVIDGVRLIPLLVDPEERIWVYQVPPAAAASR